MFPNYTLNTMKKVLFLCSSYRSGGAERAFVSLLNSLPLDKIEAHVMVIEEEGLFMNQLPQNIIIEHAPVEMVIANARIKSSYFWKHVTIRTLFAKIHSILKGKIVNRKKTKGSQQYFWNEVKGSVPNNTNNYDVVISFMGGFCNYYAIDKVDAKAKYLWVHNDYNKLGCSAEFDKPYFSAATKVATISSVCVESLKENFPELGDKFIMVENVSPTSLILEKSKEPVDDMFIDQYDFTISSVGRLFEQKGYDMAIDAANIMKDRGLNFCWYVVGEGELRSTFEKKIKEYGLENNFKLLGLRANPYPYIANSTFFVMTSRFEGKSIALDEAKILCKPILSTKYPSVYDNIRDRVDGILVEQDSVAIANGIEMLYADKAICNRLISYLRNHPSSNESMVRQQIMHLIEA